MFNDYDSASNRVNCKPGEFLKMKVEIPESRSPFSSLLLRNRGILLPFAADAP